MSCVNSSYLLVDGKCKECGVLHVGCDTCNDTACTSCIAPYKFNVTYCFLCEVEWPNCNQCNLTACTNCTSPYVITGNSLPGCIPCSQRWVGCASCDSLRCDSCLRPYRLNTSNLCEGDCSLIRNCTIC
jgi:hypothetical protein